jgi:hypothetical protein
MLYPYPADGAGVGMKIEVYTGSSRKSCPFFFLKPVADNPGGIMKINITKKEYRLLLDVFSIADWVMTSHKTGKDPKVEPYQKLEQKFLAFAKDFGYEDLVEYNKKTETYYPTVNYEQMKTDRPFIDEFEEDVFWETLCSRLAIRDMLMEKGADAISKMPFSERFIEEETIADKYVQEFVENGIKHLVLSKEPTSDT